MTDQTFGTFYDATDHEGKPPLISHVSAYVQGNYNPAWSGCLETTVPGPTGKDRNRNAREWRLALELDRLTVKVLDLTNLPDQTLVSMTHWIGLHYDPPTQDEEGKAIVLRSCMAESEAREWPEGWYEDPSVIPGLYEEKFDHASARVDLT